MVHAYREIEKGSSNNSLRKRKSTIDKYERPTGNQIINLPSTKLLQKSRVNVSVSHIYSQSEERSVNKIILSIQGYSLMTKKKRLCAIPNRKKKVICLVKHIILQIELNQNIHKYMFCIFLLTNFNVCSIEQLLLVLDFQVFNKNFFYIYLLLISFYSQSTTKYIFGISQDRKCFLDNVYLFMIKAKKRRRNISQVD